MKFVCCGIACCLIDIFYFVRSAASASLPDLRSIDFLRVRKMFFQHNNILRENHQSSKRKRAFAIINNRKLQVQVGHLHGRT